MRFPWRNKLAYMLLGVALLHYVLGGFSLLSNLNMSLLPQAQKIEIIIAWLTGPVTIIAWAAAVEYLSRIADALQRRGP
ncbi:MAG: hypothetical protein R3C30_01850 [Hyphomonadaceae bacterium]